MAQVTATIASKVGLHARPAATFVKAVAEKGVPVTIAKEGGAAVDASSILGVMTLGAGFGDVVTLASDADGAEAALKDLKAIRRTRPPARPPCPRLPPPRRGGAPPGGARPVRVETQTTTRVEGATAPPPRSAPPGP